MMMSIVNIAPNTRPYTGNYGYTYTGNYGYIYTGSYMVMHLLVAIVTHPGSFS